MRQIAPVSITSAESIKQRRDLMGTKGELDRAQHKLERAERALESLSRILTVIPDPIEVVSSDYTVLFANRASRLLHDDEQLEGSLYFQSVMGLEAPPPDCPIRRAIEDDREAAYTAACDNGDVFEVTVTPILLSDGRRAAMCLSKQPPAEAGQFVEDRADDETQLLQKIAELSTHTLDVVLDQVTDGVVMIDTTGRVVLSNAAFQSLASIDRGTEVDANVVARILCPDREEGTSLPDALGGLAAGPGVTRIETELSRCEGLRVPVELAVSRVSAESEAEAVLLVTVRDLRETSELKGRLSNAHQLSRETVATVLSLIQPDDPSTINVNHLVSEVFSRHYFDEELRMDHIEVVQRYDPGMVETTGYRNLLQRALADIIKSAREAMERAGGGGQLMALTEASERTITIRITDNGPGIPEDVRTALLDPTSAATWPAGRGGVGLQFAKDVITSHGGTIELKSRPGEGATFIIRLPVRRPSPQSGNVEPDLPPSQT